MLDLIFKTVLLGAAFFAMWLPAIALIYILGVY